MEEIHRIIKALEANEQKVVLATIIHVEGSAYRREGTTMLFQEGGKRVGTLSGGCLESDLALRAEEIMKDGSKQMFVYDMREEDDLSWGQSAGCNGLIYILLEPVDEQRKLDLLMLKRYLDQRNPVMFVQKLTKEFQALEYNYLPINGQPFGSGKVEIPDHLSSISKEKSYLRTSGIQRLPRENTLIYMHYYHPQPRIIIIGAGSDAKPLACFAKKAGFMVILADWREALCNPYHFPDADHFIIGFPKEIVRQLSLTKHDFVVLMTHQFQRDQEVLALLQNKGLAYVGVLGSGNRIKRIFGNQEKPDWVRSPVGIPIGAEGPEEIAVSILAEVICTLRTQMNQVSNIGIQA